MNKKLSVQGPLEKIEKKKNLRCQPQIGKRFQSKGFAIKIPGEGELTTSVVRARKVS
jgi:hypothetical protein